MIKIIFHLNNYLDDPFIADDVFETDETNEVDEINLRLYDGLSGETVFINSVLIICHHIKRLIRESEDLSIFAEFKRDLEISADRLQENLNDGDDSSVELDYIFEL